MNGKECQELSEEPGNTKEKKYLIKRKYDSCDAI